MFRQRPPPLAISRDLPGENLAPSDQIHDKNKISESTGGENRNGKIIHKRSLEDNSAAGSSREMGEISSDEDSEKMDGEVRSPKVHGSPSKKQDKRSSVTSHPK